MDRLMQFVGSRPRVIVAMFLIAFVAALWVHGRWARYDLSYRTMAPQSTPEVALFEAFVEIFGDDNDIYIIGFHDDPVVTKENLAMIARLSERIEALEATDSALSLTNVLDILGAEGTLDVTEFVETIPDDAATLHRLRTRLATDPIVAGTLLSRDGSTGAIVVRFAESSTGFDDRFEYFDMVEEILSEEGGGRVEFYIAGYPYLNRTLMHHMIDDTTLFIPLAIVLMCGLLWVVFGRLRATWMPMLPVIIAAVLTLGVLTACGLPMSLLTGQGVLGGLIIVIGLSDGVHLLNRYDEDVASDPLGDRRNALAKTLRHIGRACLLTSVTTAIGFGSLAVADVPSVRDFGIFGALGIFFAYLGAIVLLPAVIVLSERRGQRPASETRALAVLDRFLAGVASFAARRRRAIVVMGLVSLAAAAAAAPKAQIDNSPTRDLKRTDPAVRALEFLEANLGGAYPLEIVIAGDRPDTVKDPALLKSLEYVRAGIERLSFVSKVTSPVEFIKKMNRAMNDGEPDAYRLPATREAVAQYLLLFEMAGGDSEFDRLVNYDYSVARMTALMEDITPRQYTETLDTIKRLAQEAGLPAGVRIYASGETPIWRSATHVLISTLIRSLYLAMPLIFILTGIAFRSLRLGLISILPNLLPLTVGLGLMWPLDVSLRFSTITAFPIAFGLAVDDTIHFLARYRREIADGKSAEEAVRATITTTGRAMCLTSVLLVIGFSIFFASNFLGIIHVALLLCIVLIAALFGDLFLLPALLLIFHPRPPTTAPASESAGMGVS